MKIFFCYDFELLVVFLLAYRRCGDVDIVTSMGDIDKVWNGDWIY
jgi:hypothetical protein